MSWRYQPVYVDEDGERMYTLIEVHFDEGGKFTAWAEGDSCPAGADIEELSNDLNRMIVDAICWQPVALSDLKSGMQFLPLVSMDDRRAVADYVEQNTETMKRQPKPAPN